MEDLLVKKYLELGARAIDNYELSYMDRIRKMRLAQDPNNSNFKQKMSQKYIAELMGMHPQNYNKLEAGKRNGGNNILIWHAIRLSIIFGCSVDYILGLDDKNSVKVVSESQSQYENCIDKVELLSKQIRTLEDALEAEKTINKMLREKLESN